MKPTDNELEAVAALTADQLAQVIRKVDGENTMGAGALAEAILAALEPAPPADGPRNPPSQPSGIPLRTPPASSRAPATDRKKIAAAIRTLKKGTRQMTEYQTITEHTQMRPDDLLEYRCPRFGIVTQWRVASVRLGALGVQSLIDVLPVTKSAPTDRPAPFSVPEQMTRGLTIIRRPEQ